MITEGRVCVKNTGRDEGEKCIIINVLDNNFVEIVTRKRKNARKVNILHLTPTDEIVDPKSEEQIKAALDKA